MAFKDFTELVPPLRLPFQGTEYELPYIAEADVPTLRAALDPAAPRPDDGEIERILLGPAGEQMRSDGVPPGFKLRCILTALADFGRGRQYAELIWETAGKPEVIEAWMAEHVRADVSA